MSSATLGKSATDDTVIDSDELMDLFYSVGAPYRRRGNWMMADTTICAIRKMVDGTGRYIWEPSYQMGQPETVLGRPIVANNSMEAIAASAKPIAFGDFSFYWIANRGTATIQRLVEKYAEYNQTGFLMQQRVDGLLTITTAVKYLQMAAS